MTIALVLLAGLTACAQGKWTYSNFPADELKGQQAYTAYEYEDRLHAAQPAGGLHGND